MLARPRNFTDDIPSRHSDGPGAFSIFDDRRDIIIRKSASIQRALQSEREMRRLVGPHDSSSHGLLPAIARVNRRREIPRAGTG